MFTFHSADQIGFGRFQQQMVVVAQECPSVNPPAGSSARFHQSRHPHVPIAIISVDFLPLVTSRHEVINCFCKFNPY
jgi:hypothetical protein